MTEWLGVETWPGKRPPVRRHKVDAFPQLANQKRSESGFCHAADGVLRMPADAHRVEIAAACRFQPAVLTKGEGGLTARDATPTRAAQLFTVLLDLADSGTVLPSFAELGARIGLNPVDYKVISSRVNSALQSLHSGKHIVMAVDRSSPRHYPLPRTVTLNDGRVLRNATAA